MAKREKGGKEPVGKQLGADCRVVILYGKDAFRRGEYTNQLREQLEAKFGNVDTIMFSGAEHDAADVLDECRSFGLMATHKLIVVEDADELVVGDNRQLFERYAAGPVDDATLVLRAETFAPANLGKAVEKIGAVIKCDPLDDDGALRWVCEQCKPRHRAGISDEAAALLVDRAGTDLARLDMELAKLAVAAGESATIEKPLVESFVGKSRDEEIWAIQAKLLTSKPSERLAEIRHMMDVNRTPATLVMYALTDLARKIHAAARAHRAGQNIFSLSYKLKIFGDLLEPVSQIAKTIDPGAALRLLRASVDADRRTKSGLADADRAVEIAVLRLPRPQTSR